MTMKFIIPQEYLIARLKKAETPVAPLPKRTTKRGKNVKNS